MVQRFALIKDDIVDNVILLDRETSRWIAPPDVDLVLVADDEMCGSGDVYDKELNSYSRPISPDPDIDEQGYVVVNGERMTDESGQWVTADTFFGE